MLYLNETLIIFIQSFILYMYHPIYKIFPDILIITKVYDKSITLLITIIFYMIGDLALVYKQLYFGMFAFGIGHISMIYDLLKTHTFINYNLLVMEIYLFVCLGYAVIIGTVLYSKSKILLLATELYIVLLVTMGFLCIFHNSEVIVGGTYLTISDLLLSIDLFIVPIPRGITILFYWIGLYHLFNGRILS